MSVELIAGLVAFLLALIGGGAAWVRADQHGRVSEKLNDATENAREATKQVERRTDPVLSDRGYRDRLRRAAERLARLRDRASK